MEGQALGGVLYIFKLGLDFWPDPIQQEVGKEPVSGQVDSRFPIQNVPPGREEFRIVGSNKLLLKVGNSVVATPESQSVS